MRAWQLYLDESGNFERPKEAILIAGVLFEGRATPQSSDPVKRRLEEIFVGNAYPPHAAHHNVASSLLCGMLVDRKPEGPAAERFLRGTERALVVARGFEEAARRLRSALTRDDVHRQDLSALRTFDDWLGRADPDAHKTLVEERDRQRGDLARYAATDLARHLGRPPFVVAAWQAEAGGIVSADARYERLYEILLERALSFIARADDSARLDVHLGARSLVEPQRLAPGLNRAEGRAAAFPLVTRAKSPPIVVRYKSSRYGQGVHPGIVLADFASNTLRRALYWGTPWERAATDVRDRLGLPIAAASALLPLASALPAIASDGPSRDAIRRAAEDIKSAPPLEGAAPPTEPRWARDQAQAWIAALRGEATP